MKIIIIRKSDIGPDATADDVSALVQALRAAGWDETFSSEGVVAVDRGERPLAWLLNVARTAEQTIATLNGIADEPAPIDLSTEVQVAKLAGYAPLRKPLGFWRLLDLETQTNQIVSYVAHCRNAETDGKWQARLAAMTADCSPRLATAVRLIFEALESNDRHRLLADGVTFAEGDDRMARIGLNGLASANENGEGIRTIRVATIGRSDNEVLCTLAHEVLHHVRDHVDLLRFADTDDEYKLLTEVFDRQAYHLAEKLTLRAQPGDLTYLL